MKKILLGFVMILLSMSFVSAVTYEINLTTSSYRTYTSSEGSKIEIQQLRYEPYPVNPGEYFTLWIKAENTGSSFTKDATFELVPEYPFSFDSAEEAVKKYGGLGAEPVVLKYKIRVDKDAVEGTNEIRLEYNTDGGDSRIFEEFEIEIDDAQTDFDLVIQEVEDNTVTVAIANIGKNVADSVIVRVPKQEYFEAIGTSGQMVGNLEDGDYTLVSFEIRNTQRSPESALLQFQVSYTDNIGERRDIIKQVSFSGGAIATLRGEGITHDGDTMEERMARFGPQQKELYQEWWFWAIVVLAFYIGIGSYKRHKENKEQEEMKRAKKRRH